MAEVGRSIADVMGEVEPAEVMVATAPAETVLCLRDAE